MRILLTILCILLWWGLGIIAFVLEAEVENFQKLEKKEKYVLVIYMMTGPVSFIGAICAILTEKFFSFIENILLRRKAKLEAKAQNICPRDDIKHSQ